MTRTAPDRAQQSTYAPGGTTLTDWRPEDPDFWAAGADRVARRNLIWSIFAEHLGFSVWLMWSVSSAYLLSMGFDFTAQELFLIVAAPNFVGSLLRLPYTFAVPKFGGRTWTTISALLLLVPTLLFAVFVQRPGTPLWVFVVIAATAGFGGGNFASSMANINFFYPAARKGAALGLNAAGGNLGVALIQFFLPVLVGGAGIFGMVQASDGGIHLQRAAWVYVVLSVVAAAGAWFGMNNLTVASASARESFQVLKHKHTWVMSFLYLGTFGSFIGFSAAMPLLIKVNFWVPGGGPAGTGIVFAHYAFLGALVGSVARPFGGWLADKYGGARVTAWSFVGMGVGALGVLVVLGRLTDNPGQEIAIADGNQAWFAPFLFAFLVIFAASGIGNGSTYRMIPTIWARNAKRTGAEGSPVRAEAMAQATRNASAVIGIAGAIGAMGGFLIPMSFGAPWIDDPSAAVRGAMTTFLGFYVVCLVVTWFVYTRRSFLITRVPSLAEARV
ncbi:MFS transporter [Nocardioides alcanivorans]|uniref:MFS transporter n=1 Tax=Nocardioides alcanivorans TaxID=2897352 RepID=UPI001F3BDAC6|nr:MFS transporter [Nocardioides alcanivorans]